MTVRPGEEGFVAPAPEDRPWNERTVVRLLVQDEEDRLLLMEDRDLGVDPPQHFWLTPGGGIDEGEDERTAGIRELWEEAGLTATTEELAGPIVTRHVLHGFSDQVVSQDEIFYAVRVRSGEVTPGALTDDEQLSVVGLRWWDLDELEDAPITLWPPYLTKIVRIVGQPERWPVEIGSCEESIVPL